MKFAGQLTRAGHWGSGVRPYAGTLYTTPAGSREAWETKKDCRQPTTKRFASQLLVRNAVTTLVAIRIYSVRPRQNPDTSVPDKIPNPDKIPGLVPDKIPGLTTHSRTLSRWVVTNDD